MRTALWFAVAVVLALFAAVTSSLLTGCAPTTRADARAAVMVAARAVKIGDEACAKYSLEHGDLELARSCESAYDVARGSVVVAADLVDRWDDTRRDRIACLVAHASDELAKIAAEMKRRGATVPPVLEDALRLASALGGCRE